MEVWAVDENPSWDSLKEILPSVILYFVFQFEFECRARGADILAYPPVVAGGNRSNTLHYVKNNQLIKVHEMPFSVAPSGSRCPRRKPTHLPFSLHKETAIYKVLYG